MLDREETKLYEILVMASDTGRRTGLCSVRIMISDVNDNAPQFLLDEYKACIHSSLVINSFFLKVSTMY